MTITSTARAAFLATILVLVAGVGAQATSGAMDVANTALTVAPGKIHSVHQVHDNDSILYEIMIDGAMHSVEVGETGKVINHTGTVKLTYGRSTCVMFQRDPSHSSLPLSPSVSS